ncbi:septum formation family protein [Nocardioides pakistanensis]
MSATRRGTGTTVAVVAALLLASCTGGDPASREKTTPSEPATVVATSTPPTTSEPARATEPPAPKAGACYDLDFDAATQPTSEEGPVSCRDRHTAQTFHVGRLETVVDGHLLAVDSALAQRQVQRSCSREFVDHVGGSREERALSRLRPVWFSPTLAESDEGASWFRCDVVALGRGSTLAPLPAPKRLVGALDRRDARDEFGLCGTAAPGSAGFDRVICSRPHTWKALATIRIAGDRYPGVGAVRRAGDEACRDRVRRASGGAERFRYGWEWPTREQWESGQRYGYCWMPSRR